MSELEKLLQEFNKLEPMPVVATKLAAMVSNPTSTIDDITDVISYDPALVTNLLRWVNSALWAQNNPIVNIKDAVIRLGPGRILQIVVGKKVKSSMEKEIEEYGLDSGELWKHSIACAIASEELIRYLKIDLPTETYTAVLLHDVGKLVLKQLISPELQESILTLASSNGTTYYEAELNILGFSHSEVGYRITKQWNFGESIAQSILNHHTPDNQISHMTDAIHVSNIVAKSIGIGLGNEALNLAGSVNSVKRLGLSRLGFEQLCFTVSEKLPEIVKLYEM